MPTGSRPGSVRSCSEAQADAVRSLLLKRANITAAVTGLPAVLLTAAAAIVTLAGRADLVAVGLVLLPVPALAAFTAAAYTQAAQRIRVIPAVPLRELRGRVVDLRRRGWVDLLVVQPLEAGQTGQGLTSKSSKSYWVIPSVRGEVSAGSEYTCHYLELAPGRATRVVVKLTRP